MSTPRFDKVHWSSEGVSSTPNIRREEQAAPPKVWQPFVLRPWIPATLFSLMIIAGLGVEIAYFKTNKNNGWPLPPDPTRKDYVHYVYTWVPVITSMGIVALFAAFDHEVMRLQPYVDLAHGAKGETLMLDYTIYPKFVVWIFQVQRKHFPAALSTLVLLMLLSLQPLASSVLVIKDTEVELAPIGVPKFGTVGINDTFSNLRGFASAAGFTEADSRYDIGRPPFVWRTWAVDEFDRPTAFKSNGTMRANTTGIQTQPNCVLADQVQFTGGQLTGTGGGCQFSTAAAATGVDYGVDVVGACNSDQTSTLPDPVKPVAFWFTNPGGSPSSAMVFCSPKLSLHNVTITLNLANGQLIDVTPIGDYDVPSNVTSGPPLNGQVFNGVEFNTTGADAETLLRANTTQLQLASSVFNLLQKNTYDQVLGDAAQMVNITATRYQLFLALSARSNYFVTDYSGTNLPVVIREIQQRLWMAKLSTHLLTVVLILGGIAGALVHYLHYMERQGLKLYAAPGSIAVAASVTTDSPVHNMIRSGWDANRLKNALSGETFGVDDTGRIILARDVEPKPDEDRRDAMWKRLSGVELRK
ncbi:hypothetical protein CPB86DRAFT_782384 [Serendipita vermifera]|nr:hypothetical protein CPB86DRAFT_782384 [Serendipita vermifera]